MSVQEDKLGIIRSLRTYM